MAAAQPSAAVQSLAHSSSAQALKDRAQSEIEKLLMDGGGGNGANQGSLGGMSVLDNSKNIIGFIGFRDDQWL